MVKLIGLAGTNGAGKDTVGHLLAEHYGYLFVSVSDFIREEAKKRGLPVTREVLRSISAEWRRDFGLGVLVDRAVALFESQPGKYKGLIASPMRNLGEAQHLQQLGGKVVWVDAEPQIRYQRIQAGAAARGREGEDNRTFEQFQAEEAAEMTRQAGDDDATLNMAAVREHADLIITNNTPDINKLLKSVEQALDLSPKTA